MSSGPQKHPTKDEALTARVFEFFNEHLSADPYGWDGAFAKEIQSLPPGLRAMAATHYLDVSLTLDEIGWHFLNFGHPSHVAETEMGLRVLDLPDVAAMFSEAYQLVHPHLKEIRRPKGDYYKTIEGAGKMKRISQLSDMAKEAMGEHGIYGAWTTYARKHPGEIFPK